MAGANAARQEMEALGAALLTTARELVERNGGLYPFGGHSRGGVEEPELVTPLGEGAFPLPDRLLEEVVQGLRAAVAAGAVATGVCADVVVRPPGEGSTDAVRVLLEHPAAPPLVLLLAYRREHGSVRFGELLVAPGEALVREPG